MKKQLHYAITGAMLLIATFQMHSASATDGTGVVSVTAQNGSCLDFTAASGNGADNWEVVEGGTYTMTITGVTECSGSAITVFVQNSENGNFCFNATGGNGTYSGNFTVPNPACNTMPISYKCGADQLCDNSNAFAANGPSDNNKIHLRSSIFDGNCVRTGTDESCGGSPVCSISVSGTDVDVTCNGDEDGSIDITVTGAQGNVSFLWSDGSTDDDRTGLAPGTYTVTVTDDEGCNDSESFTVTEPNVIDINGTAVDVSLTNGSDGSINITVTGGSGSYTFSWSNGETTDDLTNLPAGTYTVTVTDEHGCSADKTFIVNEPGCSIDVTGNDTDVSCHGKKDGSIDITVTGAQGNVSYSWSDGSTLADRNNLAPGTYTVTVTDDGGCQDAESFTITEPAAVKAKISVIQNDGSCAAPCVHLSTPANANYTYSWRLNGVAAPGPHKGSTYCACTSGSYQVKVTSTNGCKHNSKPYEVVINQKMEDGTQLPAVDGNLFSAWPNPVKDNLNITMSQHFDGNVQVQLVDLFGRVISTTELNGADEDATISFNVQNLSSGVYVVRLLNGVTREEQKVIIVK